MEVANENFAFYEARKRLPRRVCACSKKKLIIMGGAGNGVGVHDELSSGITRRVR